MFWYSNRPLKWHMQHWQWYIKIKTSVHFRVLNVSKNSLVYSLVVTTSKQLFAHVLIFEVRSLSSDFGSKKADTVVIIMLYTYLTVF